MAICVIYYKSGSLNASYRVQLLLLRRHHGGAQCAVPPRRRLAAPRESKHNPTRDPQPRELTAFDARRACSTQHNLPYPHSCPRAAGGELLEGHTHTCARRAPPSPPPSSPARRARAATACSWGTRGARCPRPAPPPPPPPPYCDAKVANREIRVDT
jgi:hypothetical protein